MVSAQLCRLPRRVAAMVYDALVLTAVLFVAAIPPTILRVVAGDLLQEDTLAFRLGMTLYLLAIGFAFFGGFWTHGGQTIGMRAWRVRVVGTDGGRVDWRRAGLRYLAAIVSWLPAGAGFLWCMLDEEGLAWHDRWSRTRLVHLPRG